MQSPESEYPYFCKIPDTAPRGFRLILRFNNLVDTQLDLTRVIADRTRQEFDEAPLDIIGVEFTGNFLAHLGYLGRLDLGLEGNVLTCHTRSSRFLGYSKGLEGRLSGAPALLFDNSVRSGKTLHRATKQLQKHDVHPEYFMKMVDYQDADEARVQALVEKEGMQCLSVFTLDHVIDNPWLEELATHEQAT